MNKKQLQEVYDAGNQLAGLSRHFITSYPYWAPEVVTGHIATVEASVQRWDKAMKEAAE